MTAPATRWYFAEGAAHSGMQLFYLVQNDNATAAIVSVGPCCPHLARRLTACTTAGPHSRLAIWANTDPDIDGTELSAVVRTATSPSSPSARCTRDLPGQPFGAGHESAGVAATSAHWFLAEGQTGPYLRSLRADRQPGRHGGAV